MKVEEPFFTLRVRPGLTREQWNEVASAIAEFWLIRRNRRDIGVPSP